MNIPIQINGSAATTGHFAEPYTGLHAAKLRSLLVSTRARSQSQHPAGDRCPSLQPMGARPADQNSASRSLPVVTSDNPGGLSAAPEAQVAPCRAHRPCSITAVVVHWEAPQWCLETVMALLESRHVEVSVLVVNNGGDLHLPEVATIFHSERNIGFASAANLGINLALRRQPEWIFVGCHDLRLNPESLAAMVRQLQSDDGLAATGPVIDGAGSTEDNLEWISGAGILMRSEIADVFRFDKRLGSYAEDVDFCQRIRAKGWRIGRCGDASGVTRGSVDPRRRLVLMNANTVALYIANGRPAAGFKRLIRIFEWALGSILSGRFSEALAYGQAAVLSIGRTLQLTLTNIDPEDRADTEEETGQ